MSKPDLLVLKEVWERLNSEAETFLQKLDIGTIALNNNDAPEFGKAMLSFAISLKSIIQLSQELGKLDITEEDFK